MTTHGLRNALLGAACVWAIAADGSALAATVTFSDFQTATGKFGAPTVVDDTLDIDVSGFLANTSNPAAGSGVAFDTIAFLVTADPGYYITSIEYSEGGLATTDASSFAAATATWVVNGVPSSLGFHVFPQSSNGSFLLSSTRSVSNATSLLVSITNNLFAFGTSAGVEKNLALVEVTTAPIPEPSSVLCLLAGLGFVAFVARRRLS